MKTGVIQDLTSIKKKKKKKRHNTMAEEYRFKARVIVDSAATTFTS